MEIVVVEPVSTSPAQLRLMVSPVSSESSQAKRPTQKTTTTRRRQSADRDKEGTFSMRNPGKAVCFMEL
jgi:ribosomal protein L2